MIEVTKRVERLCFRTSRRSARRVQALSAFLSLPRSALVFLLVEYALQRLDGVEDQAAWWEAVGQLPMADLHAAISQKREAVV